MPGQQDVSGFEQNAALRRGTRNRIAKRRPDFVDPFSLRKKRKLKNEADELVSALSPCSEEGSLKQDSLHNLPVTEAKEKSNTFSRLERVRFDSERVQSLPTSNPKVKVIIRLSPATEMESLKKSAPAEPVVKLRLRLRAAAPKANPQTNGCPLPVSASSPEVGPHCPDNNLIQNPNGPQRLQVSRRSKLKTNKAVPAVGPQDNYMNNMNSKKAQCCPNLKKHKVSRTSKNGRNSGEHPQKRDAVSYREELAIPSASHQDDVGPMVHIHNMNPSSSPAYALSNNKDGSFAPKKDPAPSVDVKRKPGVRKMHESQNTSAPKVNLKLASRVSSLPIRKRPYMREVRALPSLVLRRSTRNKQHPFTSV